MDDLNNIDNIDNADNTNINANATYLSPSSFVIGDHYNIDALRDLFDKEKKINSTNIEKNNFDDQVEGRNPVLELLESGKDINKIFITRGEKHGSINKIIAMAKERKIVLTMVNKTKLNQMAQTENNQGVIAIVPPFDYCEVEDILENAKKE